MSTPKATTELEAINTMLHSIGESPVNSLSGDQNVDVALARKTLHEISRDVQTPGYHWNTEAKYPFNPAEDGTITVPANAIRVDADREYGLDIVLRGRRLYNKAVGEHTYNIGRQLKCSVVWFLTFDELPEAARRYITVRATREFQDRGVGSEQLHVFDQADEARARADFMADAGETAGYSIFDSESVARVTGARPGRRRYY